MQPACCVSRHEDALDEQHDPLVFSAHVFLTPGAEAHYAEKAGGESSHMILCFQRGEPQKQRSSAPLRVERWPQGCRPTNPQVFGDSSNGLRGGSFREPDSCSGSWLNPAWQRPVPGLGLRSSDFCHKLHGRVQVTAGGEEGWGGSSSHPDASSDSGKHGRGGQAHRP